MISFELIKKKKNNTETTIDSDNTKSTLAKINTAFPPSLHI